MAAWLLCGLKVWLFEDHTSLPVANHASSSIAAAWAMGRREREISSIDDDDDDGRERVGALRSMYLVDACCVAKAYVNAGVARGVQASMFHAHSVQTFDIMDDWMYNLPCIHCLFRLVVVSSARQGPWTCSSHRIPEFLQTLPDH